jgi:hypothetical protein
VAVVRIRIDRTIAALLSTKGDHPEYREGPDRRPADVIGLIINLATRRLASGALTRMTM